jgi:hypothetical protein
MTINAVYTILQMSYNVQVYRENVTGTGFDLYSSESRTANYGETVNFSPDAYEGFTLNNAASNLTGQVTSDGSLTLNAYYDRNEYTFRFMTGETLYQEAPISMARSSR